MSTKFKEVFGAERMVEIDGEQSTLLVQINFNARNGQFKINTAITTKQVSRTQEVNQATAQQVGQMLLDAMVEAQKMRDEWLSNNGEDLGPDLFDDPEADGGPDDEQPMEIQVGFSRNKRTN